MMQIGVQSLPAPCLEGPLADPRQTFGDELGRQVSSSSGSSSSGSSAEPGEDSLFVSPPPLPFPRVFPGL
jgi:hypothetical protein